MKHPQKKLWQNMMDCHLLWNYCGHLLVFSSRYCQLERNSANMMIDVQFSNHDLFKTHKVILSMQFIGIPSCLDKVATSKPQPYMYITISNNISQVFRVRWHICHTSWLCSLGVYMWTSSGYSGYMYKRTIGIRVHWWHYLT